MAPLFLLGSCARIYEQMPRCEIYLEFIFDHNMEYVDSFSTHVSVVDILVFDADGKYMFSKTVPADELIDGKKLALGGDLPLGRYKILSVGGMCEHFSVSAQGADCAAGSTTLEEVEIALKRQSSEISHEFPHVWLGEVADVDFSPSNTQNKVYRVPFVRNTNNFNMSLIKQDATRGETRVLTDAPYTFEIEAPEGGVYSYENEPVALTGTCLVYSPHTLGPGTLPDNLSVGKLNTMRLFSRDGYDYKLVVRNTKTLKAVWEYDLMTILENTKPNRPDGSHLPMQEYLDRQGEWNIAVLYKGDGGDVIHDGFVAIAVQVNGWIYWLTDVEV